MSTITTRAGKGTPLTNSEIDANFTNLNTDKLEKAGGTVSGALTVNGAFSAAAGISSTAVSLTGGAEVYCDSSAGSLTVKTTAAIPLVFGAGDAEAMRVAPGGNVGIGTSAPGWKLDVGSGASQVVARINGGASGSEDGAALYLAAAGSPFLAVGNWSSIYGGAFDATPAVYSTGAIRFRLGGGDSVWMTTEGNLGIGTSSPAGRLDVQASTNAYARVKATTTGYAMIDVDSAASQQALVRWMAAGLEQGRIFSGANEGAGIMAFATGTGATEAMRLIGGRVAINRNSASFSTGTARTAIDYPGNTDWALGLRDTSAQPTVYPIVFLNSSEGIAGSVAMTATSTSYNTSSDERLKENIEDAADPGAVIDAIQIRQFDWIATGEHQDYGVVAQELEQVYPPAVTEATLGPDGEEMYRGVDYSKLVPLLVKEVQLLRARVAQLEGGSQ